MNGLRSAGQDGDTVTSVERRAVFRWHTPPSRHSVLEAGAAKSDAGLFCGQYPGSAEISDLVRATTRGAKRIMSQAVAAPVAATDRAFLKSFGWIPPRLIDAVLAAIPPDSLPTDLVQRRRWLLYAVLQQTAESHTLDFLAWANDERAKDFLDKIADGTLPTTFTELGRWLKYLPNNRAKKHFRRLSLLQRYRTDLVRVGLLVPPDPPSPDAHLLQTERLADLQSRTTNSEWHLLQRAAAEPLMAIAASESLPLGTIKSLLSRCRRRLRMVC
jgi:hypothetical protein